MTKETNACSINRFLASGGAGVRLCSRCEASTNQSTDTETAETFANVTVKEPEEEEEEKPGPGSEPRSRT